MIEVLDPGFLSTIQDGGRPALAHLGVALGGAADTVAYGDANRLVGNDGGEAAIEMTLKGATFRFSEDATFAITGAAAQPWLDDAPVPAYRTLRARAGQTLAVGPFTGGARAYFAPGGGIATPLILGSRSAIDLRPLRKGETLPLGKARGVAPFGIRPPEAATGEIRITEGTAFGALTAASRDALLSSEFEVSDQANRGGLRLTGPVLSLRSWEEPVTEGVIWGTVQLPRSGQPVILMNDQTTTGGYPRISQVILRDRPRLGQLRPRDTFRFRLVSMEEALTQWRTG